MYCRFIHSDILHIRIQNEEELHEFNIHKALICERSPYFKSATSGRWGEMHDNTLEVKDVDIEGFGLWLQLLYTGKLGIDRVKDGKFLPQFDLIIKTYVVAERFLDMKSKNALINAAFSRALELRFLSPTTITRLYEGTPGNSHMRQLTVDMWLIKYNENTIIRRDQLPKDFLADLAEKLLRCRPGQQNSMDDFIDSLDVNDYLEEEYLDEDDLTGYQSN